MVKVESTGQGGASDSRVVECLARELVEYFDIRWGQGAPVCESEATVLARQLLRRVQAELALSA